MIFVFVFNKIRANNNKPNKSNAHNSKKRNVTKILQIKEKQVEYLQIP